MAEPHGSDAEAPDDPRVDEDEPDDAWEPVYPDGSPVHECWHRDV